MQIRHTCAADGTIFHEKGSCLLSVSSSSEFLMGHFLAGSCAVRTVLGSWVCHLSSAIKSLCCCSISFVAPSGKFAPKSVSQPHWVFGCNRVYFGHATLHGFICEPHTGVSHSGDLRSANCDTTSNGVALCIQSECGWTSLAI